MFNFVHTTNSVAMATLSFTVAGGCARQYPTSLSANQSRDRGVFLAEYQLVGDARLGSYEVVEVWVESQLDAKSKHLVVRLKGPHHDSEPRVVVTGSSKLRYETIWSKRDGPPYEIWTAPDPLPRQLKLEREDKCAIAVLVSQ